MSVDIDGRVLRCLDLGIDSFRKGWNKLPGNVQKLAQETIRSLLLLDLDAVPAKLHLHQLTGKSVPSRLDPKKKVAVWTLHLTANDDYKASFTLEDGTAYFRVCGKHDAVDKKP